MSAPVGAGQGGGESAEEQKTTGVYKNKRFRSMRGEKALISYILWAFQGEKALDKHSGNEYK